MELASLAQLDALLAKHTFVVIDYHADWCGPCKSYSPKFQRIEREVRRAHPDANVVFASVDIDRAQALAHDANVMSVPTTIAWTMGKNLFGRPKRKQALRFSGDRSWPDLLRTMGELVSRS